MPRNTIWTALAISTYQISKAVHLRKREDLSLSTLTV
jgi:hypothetical protein